MTAVSVVSPDDPVLDGRGRGSVSGADSVHVVLVALPPAQLTFRPHFAETPLKLALKLLFELVLQREA